MKKVAVKKNAQGTFTLERTETLELSQEDLERHRLRLASLVEHYRQKQASIAALLTEAEAELREVEALLK